MDYDSIYKANAEYFGTEPDPVLPGNLSLISRDKPVLDIGAGQGRHALYLARAGFRVQALERSATGSGMIKSQALHENLPVDLIQTDIRSFKAEANSFSAILLMGVLQELEWQAIQILVTDLYSWIASYGIIFVTAFSTQDPGFKSFPEAGAPCGPNSFKDAEGAIHTYLEPNQIEELFSAFETVHHWEGFGPFHQHGDNKPHRHARIEAIFQKRSGEGP